jgi:hypothetical protein
LTSLSACVHQTAKLAHPFKGTRKNAWVAKLWFDELELVANQTLTILNNEKLKFFTRYDYNRHDSF